MKAKPFGPPCPDPPGARGFEQCIGAGDIGIDESARPVDGAIHMGFRREMHDGIRRMGGKEPVHRGAIPDISLYKGIIGRIRHLGHIIETGRIGQRVEVDDLMPGTHRLPHHGRADEPGPAGDDQLHAAPSQVKGLSKSASTGAAASLPESTGSLSSPQSIPISGSSKRTAPSQSGA